MEAHIGLIFKLGKYKYKVIKITETEIQYCRLESDNTESDKRKNIARKDWPPKDAIFDDKEVKTDEGNKFQDFIFRYDKNGELTILKDGKLINKFDIRGPEGKPGADGVPGKDGADGAPGKDGTTGQPGKDGVPGKDGRDGVEGKQGPEGKQGITGPKGEDGVYWYPEISEDGTQLRFKNRNDSSDVTE